jgi:hypothetical protein
LIKIEVEKIKQFMGKLQEIKATEENCIHLIKEKISDKAMLDRFLQASK